MPRPTQTTTTANQFARTIDEHLDAMAAPIAEALGPAAGTDRYTAKETEDLWDTKDESVDTQQLYAALQSGMPPENVQAVTLFRMAPELGKLVTGTPQPPDVAAAIAKLAEYPGRYVLTAWHSQEPADQVKFVEDMHKKAAKRQLPAGWSIIRPQQMTAPEPAAPWSGPERSPEVPTSPPAPPTMPSAPDYGGYT